MTAVRLELAALLSFEEGGDVCGRCSIWGGVPHVEMGTYLNDDPVNISGIYTANLKDSDV